MQKLLREYIREKIIEEIILEAEGESGIFSNFFNMFNNNDGKFNQKEQTKKSLLAAKNLISKLMSTVEPTVKKIKIDDTVSDKNFELKRIKDELIHNIIFSVLTALRVVPNKLELLPMKSNAILNLANAQKIAAQNLMLAREKSPIEDKLSSNVDELYDSININVEINRIMKQAQRPEEERIKAEKIIDKIAREDAYVEIERLRKQKYDINAEFKEKVEFLLASLKWLRENSTKGKQTSQQQTQTQADAQQRRLQRLGPARGASSSSPNPKQK